MKKIALTSLLAVFAVSGAHAANVIDGNPLYMPKAGHFYSETSLATHSEPGRTWTLAEEFGYGITDHVAVDMGVDLAEKAAFDSYTWDNLWLDATFRVLDMGAWKGDLVLGYMAGDAGFSNLSHGEEAGALAYHIPGESKWFDKDAAFYTWTYGVRGGYVASDWTLAGHAIFGYWNQESFKWNAAAGEQGVHTLALGLDAQYVFTPHLNLVAGVEYTGVLDKHYMGEDTPDMEVKNAGIWTGTLGVNYNIDATKYVGLYINGKMNHQGGDNHDKWVAEKGFGGGIKFGIDF